MVTRILTMGLLSITLSYLLGFSMEAAIFPLLMTLVITGLLHYIGKRASP